MKKIRTRYAPSPTGYLHIGGARTALFCYLFAKHLGGEFIIRIEDTDQERNVVNGEKSQIDNLEWLGVIADESPLKPNPKYAPYRQSEKLDRYKQIANELVQKGFAYKAYDTTQELEAQRHEQESRGINSFRYDANWLKISDEEKQRRDKNGEYVIRVKLQKNKIYSWDDLVRGKIEVNTDDIGDYVIIKQDGFPTYNFAVVIDDHDMEITHILRGEEHVANTPKQLVIYDYLGWEVPEIGHLTIITNMAGQKLSKRDTSLKQFIEDYKNEGYIPEAIFNFLALLGWTHPNAKEILSQEEIIKAFDYHRLSKSPSKFDIAKMDWFSKEYFKNISNNEITSKLNINSRSNEWQELFAETYKNSVSTYKQLKEFLALYDTKEVKQIESSDVISTFKKIVLSRDFTIENIKDAINQTQEITGKKGKDLFMPIRLATTYVEHGPELAKCIYLFGQEIIKERLEKLI